MPAAAVCDGDDDGEVACDHGIGEHEGVEDDAGGGEGEGGVAWWQVKHLHHVEGQEQEGQHSSICRENEQRVEDGSPRDAWIEVENASCIAARSSADDPVNGCF